MNKTLLSPTCIALASLAYALSAGPALADGIVAKIVSSPLAAASTVRGARTSINVYLQRPAAPGIEFMDPKVLGYGIPAGGRIEIELGGGFERDPAIPISATGIMLVTGAPQQGLPGKRVGYTVREGGRNTFVIEPATGLPAMTLVSPTPGSALDPIRQRGIKVFHIGFKHRPFTNKGEVGRVEVRIVDGAGKVAHRGAGEIRFLASAVPQIHPTNIPDGRRNHNWQRIKPGETLGRKEGTVPIALMLYRKAVGVPPRDLNNFRDGIRGAGVLSTRQLKAMGFEKPKSIQRYTGGLIVQDTDQDGRLDPRRDRIIGGVIGAAPKGATGQELRTLEYRGQLVLSELLARVMPKIGKRLGGAAMVLQFTGGDRPGKYRPTLALLSEPGDLASPDGSSYTYTIVVE